MAEDTFTHILLGREMQFRKAKRGQLLMLFRMRGKLKNMPDDTDSRQMWDSLNTVTERMLDLIDSLFLDENDREDVERAMINGTLDIDDLTPLLGGGVESEQVADDEDPKPRKTAGRKAPAKRAAKKVANGARTKR